jgi:xanthine dehydrogenase YagS FAD-binding subunit
MNPFEFHRANGADAAVAAISPDGKFLAGGTNLVDLMKNGVEMPQALVDINRAGLDKIEELPGGGIRLGALARNSDTANHPLVRQRYPLLSRAILSGASPQLRNLATNGGNLLQRTRCPYFMDTGFAHCNKRKPGSGCDALQGFNRVHAIFGASEQCIAVHPSDMCVALAALDAVIRVRGKNGERQIPIAQFHRDRASYEFALVSAATGLEIVGGNIRNCRIALGGVAHKPWRAEGAEKLLAGQAPSRELFERAGQEAVAGAKPYQENVFKVELARRVVVRALSIAGGVA